MPPRKHTDETIETARALYAEGLSVPKIAERVGVPAGSLRYHLAKTRQALAQPPRYLRQRVRKNARPLLIARLWATAERQVNEIDTRLAEAGGDAASLERDAKTLSVLARTVRDLVALDSATQKKPDAANAETDPPRDLDAFRRALAEKLVELGRLEHGD